MTPPTHPTGASHKPCIVMAVVNATPDSFSGDGLYTHDQDDSIISAIGSNLQSSGVQMADVGGESTRPWNTPISIGQEIERIAPVLDTLTTTAPEIVISVDTSRTPVAEYAAANGATIINDVAGFRRDPTLAEFVADSELSIVLTSSAIGLAEPTQNRMGGGYHGEQYNDVVEDTLRELERLILIAQRAGIADQRIIVDPGIGMGKSTAQSVELTIHLDKFVRLGFPILYGPSRKRFIGELTGVTDPARRVFGTAAAVSCAVAGGAAIVRVHDVEEMSQVVRVANALCGRDI